jgi:glutamate decarboxylase
MTQNVLKNARYLSQCIEGTDKFEMLNTANLLPIVTFKLKDTQSYSVFDISHKLHERGWILPAYTLPANAESISIMRIVVKENFSRDMADMLFKDIANACNVLEGTRKETLIPARSPRKGHHIT